jgi:hypothetical protein
MLETTAELIRSAAVAAPGKLRPRTRTLGTIRSERKTRTLQTEAARALLKGWDQEAKTRILRRIRHRQRAKAERAAGIQKNINRVGRNQHGIRSGERESLPAFLGALV